MARAIRIPTTKLPPSEPGNRRATMLTAASVAKLKPHPERRREIPDRRMPGLYLLVQPSGRKSWAVRYRRDGKSRKYTIGPYPAFDLSAARREAAQVLQRAELGGDPAREKWIERRRRAEAKDDFENVVRLFIQRHAIGSKGIAEPQLRTWWKVARALGLGRSPSRDEPDKLVVVKDGIVAKWGERKLGDIHRRDIKDLLGTIVARDAPIQANRVLGYLHKVFAWAVDDELISVNPCAGVKPLTKEVSRARVLSDAEIVRFWSATAVVSEHEQFGQVLRLLLLTGCRLNEVAGMLSGELSDDLGPGTWDIPGTRTKNKRPHMVPLSPLALDVLATARPVGNLMFSITGKRPITGWSKVKHRLDAEMKVPPWRLHDLRRTATTRMADLGVLPHIVEACVNHVSGAKAGVAGTYNRAEYLKERRSAFERLAAHIEHITSGKPADNVVALSRRG
jgi:integrase